MRLFLTKPFAFMLIFLSCLSSQLQAKPTSIQEELAALEAQTGARIGVSAVNTANHDTIQYRANERFAAGSTFKVMPVSMILHQSMANKNLMMESMSYQKSDIKTWSPITEKRIDRQMTLTELCAAAMIYSDNTAATLLLKKLGGIEAVNSFARTLNDQGFKLEPLPKNIDSDPLAFNATTTPNAMQKSLQQLALGQVLAKPEREQLVNWMKHNTTGNARIRAGVPKAWIVADKTGSGSTYGIANDIAVVWPPQGQPLVLAIYTAFPNKEAHPRPDIVAKATRLIIAGFNRR